MKIELDRKNAEVEALRLEVSSLRNRCEAAEEEVHTQTERADAAEEEVQERAKELEECRTQLKELEASFTILARERDSALSEAAQAAADADVMSRQATSPQRYAVSQRKGEPPAWATAAVRVRLAGAATTLQTLRATASSLRALVGEFANALQKVDGWFGAPLRAMLARQQKWEAVVGDRAQRLQLMLRQVRD